MEAEAREILRWIVMVTVALSMVAVSFAAVTVIGYLGERWRDWLRDGGGPLEW